MSYEAPIEHNEDFGILASEQTGRPAEKDISALLSLFTPSEILEQKSFERPEVITPMSYPSFGDLLTQRSRIQRLQLVPVKDDYQYQRYHSQPYEQLISDIKSRLSDQDLVISQNDFPYFLPTDVKQNIIWIKEFSTIGRSIAIFIANLLQERNIPIENVIIFERPLNTSSPLIRGTVKQIRHMHLWHAK